MTEESQLYPATYRAPMKKQAKPLLTTLSLALLGFAGKAHLTLSSPLWLLTFAFVLLVLGIFANINAGMCRVTLYDDHIEKRTWLGRQTWRREEVALISSGKCGGFRLSHRYNNAYYFKIPAGIERDAAWDVWLAGVPEYNDKPSLLGRMFKRFRGKETQF